jgi:hypothetical protein
MGLEEFKMMRMIIKFIKEIDPQNEVANLNPFRLTEQEHIKVFRIIQQWAKDGIKVDEDFLIHAEFSLRHVK